MLYAAWEPSEEAWQGSVGRAFSECMGQDAAVAAAAAAMQDIHGRRYLR
jgi:hypothetical protein